MADYVARKICTYVKMVRFARLIGSTGLASGITGEVTYVDCGYNIAGLAAV